MTVPTADTPFPVLQSEGPPAPYASAVTVKLDKSVNLVQLTDEIAAKTGRVVHLALSSDDDGASLSVSPGTVDVKQVAAVVAQHDPMSDYGVPAEEKRFQEILRRVQESSDIELTEQNINDALIGLLRRFAEPGIARNA